MRRTPDSHHTTERVIIFTGSVTAAAAAGRDLRDLAALAAGIQARSRPGTPDDDGPGPVFEDRQCGWRPRSAAPGSWPGISPPNAPRW